MLVCVNNCQNATLLVITCRGSYVLELLKAKGKKFWSNRLCECRVKQDHYFVLHVQSKVSKFV